MSFETYRDRLKRFGVQFYRDWGISEFTLAVIDAYLLEQEVIVTDLGNGKTTEQVVYHPLVISAIGKKTHVDKLARHMQREDVMLPMSHAEYKGGSAHAYRVRRFFYGEDPAEAKKNGLNYTPWEPIPGTLEWRRVIYRSEIFESRHSDAYLRGYMIGVDEADAEQGFPRILGQSIAPLVDEWLPVLVPLIKAQAEWVQPLVGHQMAGFKVNIPKDGLLGLIQEHVRNGDLTVSDATLRKFGIDPAAVAA